MPLDWMLSVQLCNRIIAYFGNIEYEEGGKDVSNLKIYKTYFQPIILYKPEM